MAVDSRASMGHYISSESVRKVIEISGKKLATIAGGAADCQYWEAWLSEQVRMFELRHGKEPSVAAASRMMVNLINHYKRYGLSMGLMISGVDEDGPHLYYINTEGSRIKGDIFSVGSGMTYAYGVLDTFYRYDMTLEEAVELGRKAIYHATNRDTGSGGVVRVYHVHKDGWTEKVAGDDVNKLHYQYLAEKGFETDASRGRL